MSRDPAITERPTSLPTETVKTKTGCGEFYVTLSQDADCFEIDLHLGKSGSCQQAFLEAIRGLLTICRRQLHPIPRALILKQIEGINCPMSGPHLPSCPHAIAKVLREEWGLKEEG